MAKDNFETYVKRILNLEYPKLQIEKETTATISNMILNLLVSLVTKTNVLKTKKTLAPGDVETVIKCMFGRTFAAQAIEHARITIEMLNKGVSQEEKDDGKQRMRRSERAGLVFPIARVENIVRKYSTFDRVYSGAPVYLASVLELICTEIIFLAGGVTQDNKKQRITVRHVKLAVESDDELRKVFKNQYIGGGVVPYILPELL